MMDAMNNSLGVGYGHEWIIGLLILVVVIGLIISALRHRKNPNRIKYNSPQDILIKRIKGKKPI